MDIFDENGLVYSVVSVFRFFFKRNSKDSTGCKYRSRHAMNSFGLISGLH